jgi:hypothetical protein
MKRYGSIAVVCGAVLLGGASCVEVPGEDGGPEPLVCTGEGMDPATMVGETGTDWQPFASGAVLSTWPRPQGGIGTRVNVRAEGYADEQTYEGLTTEAFGPAGATCDESTNPCADDREVCMDGACHFFIANQVNRTFPVECAEDGSLLVPELPIRFRNDFELDELDGLDVELRVSLDPSGDTPATVGTANVTLQVGDFVQPSWWEDA